MAEKIKIGIGAPTYNSVSRLEQLLTSLEFYKDDSLNCEVKTVILDDGTKDIEKREGVRELALRFGTDFIQHETNLGIPAAWNSLTNHFKDISYMVLFNDDISVSQNWLRNFLYFMENNKKVGACGFQIVHINPATSMPDKQYAPPGEDGIPGKVGSPAGCGFGFRKSLWEQVVNSDSSVGFWVSLCSFYEELSFSFELAKMGYYSFQLPTPNLDHWGSRTFSENSSLSVRPIIDYFPKEEYLSRLKENKNLWIPFEQHEKLAESNLALRMDYARMMFAKHWGCDDYLNNPQASVHSRYVDILPPIEIKWLDRNGNEKEQLI